jgi:hypothetical protein
MVGKAGEVSPRPAASLNQPVWYRTGAPKVSQGKEVIVVTKVSPQARAILAILVQGLKEPGDHREIKTVNNKVQADLVKFANTWMKNISEQQGL